MVAKVSTGGGFAGAAGYNEAGLTQKQKEAKAGKVEFLGSFNLMSDRAGLIAQEMVSVASSSRSQQPCWNVSLSAAPGQVLTNQEWQQASEHYMRRMGASPETHQAAIWRHHDTGHDHVHILINAVPLDGGPALLRYNSHHKAKEIAQELDQTYPILKPAVAQTMGTRQEISIRLANALSQKPTTPDELKADLLAIGVRIEYGIQAKGINGVTFQLVETEHKPIEHKPIKGTDIELEGGNARWKSLSLILEANRAAYEAEIARLREEVGQAKDAQKIADEAVEKAEKERDTALNQPPTIVTETKEKEVSNSNDKAEIKRLKDENKKLTKDNEDGKVEMNDLIKGHKLAIDEVYLKRDTIKKAFDEIASIKPLPPKEVEKTDYRDSPAQQVIITEQAREIAGLKEQLKFREWITDALKSHFKCEPTPERVIALEEGKRIAIPEIGHRLWIQDKKIQVEPLTLKERFVNSFSFAPDADSLAKLEAGKRLNFSKFGKTIWLESGKLRSKPYVAPIHSVAPAGQTTTPTPNQQKAPETRLQPGSAADSTTRTAPRKEDLERIASATKTTDSFTDKLKAEGIHREKNSDGAFVYGPQKQLWGELVPGSKGPGEYFIKETQQQSRGPRMG